MSRAASWRSTRGDLLRDQIAIALVEVIVEIEEIRAREQIVRAREYAFGECLLLDAVHLPAAHERRPVRVPQAAQKNPRCVDERLDRVKCSSSVNVIMKSVAKLICGQRLP